MGMRATTQGSKNSQDIAVVHGKLCDGSLDRTVRLAMYHLLNTNANDGVPLL